MLPLSIIKKGFNYSQDGPGNRLVYHLAGCNLRCPWCANPEALFDRGAAEPVLPGEILRQVLSAKAVLIDSGGVTFTGGEPTLQIDALLETLSMLRENDIHTAIETNGTYDDPARLLPLLSLLIIDFKHYDDKKHKAVTGASNAQVIENIRIADKSGLPVWIRTPLINGFNTADEDITGFLDIYSTLDKKNISFELLPYHEYGRDKWLKLDLDYMVSSGTVSSETICKFEDAYRAAGLSVIRT